MDPTILIVVVAVSIGGVVILYTIIKNYCDSCCCIKDNPNDSIIVRHKGKYELDHSLTEFTPQSLSIVSYTNLNIETCSYIKFRHI